MMCLRTSPEQDDVPLHFSEEAEGSYHAFTPAVHLPESNKTGFFSILFYFNDEITRDVMLYYHFDA